MTERELAIRFATWADNHPFSFVAIAVSLGVVIGLAMMGIVLR